jgi:predicted DCC family thiol-disulfide oxidoreductase YuxK
MPLLVFDGHCVLCSSGVAWMMARDAHGTSRFAAIQTEIPHALYRHFGLDADAFDTFMVLANGTAHVRWHGLLAAARTLPAPWKWLGTVGRIVPQFLGDMIYDWVQRHRIGWFGTRSSCFLPDSVQQKRFLLSADSQN